MIPIMIQDATTGIGAVAVPEMIASTGPPPKNAEPISARLEKIARWSILVSAPAIDPVILPNEIFAPIFRHARDNAPRTIFRFVQNFYSMFPVVNFSLSLSTAISSISTPSFVLNSSLVLSKI